jgi:hypothetical protein
LVRATRQIPISASPPLGHPEDWVWWARAHIRKERECIGHPGKAPSMSIRRNLDTTSSISRAALASEPPADAKFKS